jgi:hypothetical protein
VRLSAAFLVASYFSLIGCSSGAENDQPNRIVEESRRYSGLWLRGFESSTFLENVDQVPTRAIDTRRADWLEYSSEVGLPGIEHMAFDEAKGCYPVHAFSVELIGRRVTYPCSDEDLVCGAGHLGGWGSEIIVDRLISAKPLASPKC